MGRRPCKPQPFQEMFQVYAATLLLHFAHNRSPAITQNAMCKQLAVEEAEQMVTGTAYVLHQEISASQLITMGLDFEEQQ